MENFSTKIVENWQAFCLLFALWKMWKTFPQKLWKSDVHDISVRALWKTFSAMNHTPQFCTYSKNLSTFLAHLSTAWPVDLGKNPHPFIHRLWKMWISYPQKMWISPRVWTYGSVRVIDSLSDKITVKMITFLLLSLLLSFLHCEKIQ
ncbi:MAG TPA: hypothetical protein VGF67_06090 [Ktedonobacteraceae bacterium]